MHESIRKQFIPMELPEGVVGRSMDWEATQEAIKPVNHLIFAPGFKEAVGVFEAPPERREKLERLAELHTRSQPECIVFFDEKDDPVGWFYGYMEDEETFFIDTIGLVPAFRGKGIYTAFLAQLIACLQAMGYERLTVTHHPNNRAALIADLKAGFNIVGLELHEGLGSAVKLAYPLHDDRRRGFERVFRTGPEPESGAGQARNHREDKGTHAE